MLQTGQVADQEQHIIDYLWREECHFEHEQGRLLIIYGEKNVILNMNKGGLAAVILFICRLERFDEIIFFKVAV